MRLPALLFLLLVAAGLTRAADSGRPNVLWFIVDDMSANLSCYGEKVIQTPHLDRLAREGTRFSRAFTTAPVCSPCRSAFITGMYQTSIGAHHHRKHIGLECGGEEEGEQGRTRRCSSSPARKNEAPRGGIHRPCHGIRGRGRRCKSISQCRPRPTARTGSVGVHRQGATVEECHWHSRGGAGGQCGGSGRCRPHGDSATLRGIAGGGSAHGAHIDL